MIFTTLSVRNERHLRLFFSSNPDPTAFTGTGTIAVTNTDGLGASPGIRARLAVPGTPAAMELVLDSDIVVSAVYSLALTALPGADATTVTTTAPFQRGGPAVIANDELKETDLQALIYGVDIMNLRGEFLESISGDLATVTGVVNVRGALERRASSSGIPWRPSYGAKPREYVDGTPGGVQELVGVAANQFVLDPRVTSATAKLSPPDPANPGQAAIDVQTLIVGVDRAQTFQVNFK